MNINLEDYIKLLEIIDIQNNLITKLINDNAEQKEIIKELLRV